MSDTFDHIKSNSPWGKVQSYAAKDMTLFSIKTLIILWCLTVIVITIFTNNKWILGGILAYEILP